MQTLEGKVQNEQLIMAMLLRTIVEKAEILAGAWGMGNFTLVTKKQRVLNMS